MDRGLTKPAWKFLYRLMRVGHREAEKASVDCMIFGTGVVVIDENGPRHVPIEEWRAEVKAGAVNTCQHKNRSGEATQGRTMYEVCMDCGKRLDPITEGDAQP